MLKKPNNNGEKYEENPDDEEEVEEKKVEYKYFVHLKTPKSYVAKDGTPREFDVYYCTDVKTSSVLENSIELTIENKGGSRKVHLDKNLVDSIEEKL